MTPDVAVVIPLNNPLGPADDTVTAPLYSTSTSTSTMLSGMVRVSDVPHWTKSAGTTPPTMLCLKCSASLDE